MVKCVCDLCHTKSVPAYQTDTDRQVGLVTAGALCLGMRRHPMTGEVHCGNLTSCTCLPTEQNPCSIVKPSFTFPSIRSS
jgi:hypothetical protein